MASGAYRGPYSFQSRFQEGDGTNPEELIGAAHALFLDGAVRRARQGGTRPESVESEAIVHLEEGARALRSSGSSCGRARVCRASRKSSSRRSPRARRRAVLSPRHWRPWGRSSSTPSWSSSRVWAAAAALRLRRATLVAHERRDPRAEQLHGAQDVGVGDRADAHLREEARVPEELVLEQDLLRDLVRVVPRPARPAASAAPRSAPPRRRPAALAPDAVHHRLRAAKTSARPARRLATNRGS